jgi:hypothetical protein
MRCHFFMKGTGARNSVFTRVITGTKEIRMKAGDAALRTAIQRRKVWLQGVVGQIAGPELSGCRRYVEEPAVKPIR